MAETNGTAVDLQEADTKVTSVEEDSPVEEATKGQVDVTNGKGSDVVSDLDKQIIRQIEYYFGDVNLPRDKFLQEQIKLEEGWIPLDIMLKFKRLANLSSDSEVILNSLAKSENKLMEISEDRKKIRRSPEKPLPIFNEDRRKELMTRTVYAKGFPIKETTLDDVLVFFGTFAPIENIQMRTLKDKATSTIIFKGSVYAMFKTVEGAKAFLDLESVKFKDTELMRKWQSEHLEQKRVERQSRDDKKSSGGNKKVDEKKSSEEPAKELELAKGYVIHCKGFNEDATREEIKKQLTEIGVETGFIHFSKGDGEGWVRLEKENTAQDVVAKLTDGKLTVAGGEVEVRCLEGEEEDAFLVKSMEEIKMKRAGRSGRGGGRGRGFRGGGRGRGGFRGGNRGGRRDKRKGSPTRGGGSEAKKQAT